MITVNDQEDTAMVEYLVVMTHDNNGTNGNGNNGNGNDNNGTNGNGNNGNGNGSPSYSAYTTDTGVALLTDLETGNYTLEVFDDEGNSVYTSSTLVTEEREIIRIVLD